MDCTIEGSRPIDRRIPHGQEVILAFRVKVELDLPVSKAFFDLFEANVDDLENVLP